MNQIGVRRKIDALEDTSVVITTHLLADTIPDDKITADEIQYPDGRRCRSHGKSRPKAITKGYMSVKCIDQIIRKHTGANASDTVKITHDEVVAMIRCTEGPSKISIGDRAELMAALKMFGGNEIHPDIFSSPQDKAAIAQTAMEGIETAERFAKLTPGAQAAFIWKCLIVGSGDTVGFTDVRGNITDLNTELQGRVARFMEMEKEKAGPKYEDEAHSWVTIYNRGSEAYAYVVDVWWYHQNNDGSWDAEAYYGPYGELLKATGGYQPPDPPDSLQST